MTHRIETQTDIDASAEEVWAVLTDFDSYVEWNPFIREISGEVKKSSRLRVTIQPGDKKPMTFKPTVQVVDQGHEFAWLGRLGLPGIADGKHSFRLEALDNGGTRLHHTEEFRGVLVPLMMRKVGADTRAGFEEMNQALRSRVEAAERARP